MMAAMSGLVAIAVSLVMAGAQSADGGHAPASPANKDGPPPSVADRPAPKAAPAAKPGAGKLAPEVAKEMADSIVAVNKSLGLESWPQHGVKPCIDRGGQGVLAKDVKPDEARKCAAAAVEKGTPELGKSYVLGILMGEIGPVTVIALGTGEQAGWGAYSCDPTKSCKPMKINPANKWGKRLDERRAKACGDAATIWLPGGQKACP
jgi:hypothetical protein